MDIVGCITEAADKIKGLLEAVKDAGDAALQAKINSALNDTVARLTQISEAALQVSMVNHSIHKQAAELLKENSELKCELARLGERDKELVNYHLQEVAVGAYAYVSHPSHENNMGVKEPEHWLCPQCYNKGHKSILQAAGVDKTDRIYKCHSLGCGLEVRVYIPCSPKTRSR